MNQTFELILLNWFSSPFGDIFKRKIHSNQLTCNVQASVQPNCLLLLYYRQRREHVDEIRVPHSKMDSYGNAIQYNEIEEYDALHLRRPFKYTFWIKTFYSVRKLLFNNNNNKRMKQNQTNNDRLTSIFSFHIRNVRIWKLANCSSATIPMWISP